LIDTQLVTFAGVPLLLAVTPGPDMAVVTRNTLAHGLGPAELGAEIVEGLALGNPIG